MGYVKHDRTKTLSQALIGDRDTIYYTSDNRAIVINGVEYGRKLVVTTQENFTELLKNAQLDSGTTYCIKGFTTKVHESSGLISAGHKIDLYVEALGPTNIKSRAYASYNTDGTDSFYEDRCIKVLEWDIKVSVIGSALGIALGMSVAPKEVAQLHSGSCKAVAHNKVDTLIVAYTNSDKVSISKDGGETFYTRTLPHKYTDTQDIIYGNNTFVIFEADGNLCVSKDNGETWRLITNVQYADVVAKSSINSQYYSGYTSACFGDNEFFIIGNGVGIRSVDGISWSTFVWGGYDNGWYKPCVAVGDGIIGITAYYGKIYWSFNNGSSFTLSNPEYTYWEGIGFGNHTFSIVSGNRHGAIVLNTDLITSISWGGDNYYIGYIAVAKDPGKVSYNNGTFYCFGAYNPDSNYSYSEDGANWVSIPFPKSTYQGGYGQTRVDFGPAGEMYFADTLSNSIWMNPTPKDASTWQILSPTGIDIYDHSAISENACIIVPQESSSYYLSTDGVAYASYKFPGKMSSGGVIYVNKLFQTILYNLTTKRAFYAKSSDGISWILTDFPHEVNSVCSTIVTSEDGANILCIFEDGAKFWIRGDLVTPVSSTNYTSVHATYINNSFIYSGSNSGGNASKITKITQLENNTLSAEDIALPQSMVVSHVTSDSSTVYISGYDNSNKSTVYTYSFDSLSNTWSNLNLSGYITSSTKNGSKVIACTNLYNLYVLNYGEITEVPGIQVSNVYPTDNSTILCQLAGSDEMRTLGYTIVNDLQITELTDEFGNTCRFDFKNLKRTLGGTEVYFLGNGLEDYSLTGAVVNFKLKYGNDDTLLSTQFDIHNQLNCCELVGATSGIFTFPSGGNNISIGNTNTGCNFYNIGNVINNTSLKWVSSDANVLAVADLSLDARYLTTDSGITWSVDQTDSIPLPDITNLVLPQNPEGE